MGARVGLRCVCLCVAVIVLVEPHACGIKTEEKPQGEESELPQVILDTDPAMMVPFGLDLDDDLALLLALHAKLAGKIDLLGVTTTFGNAPTVFTDLDARRMLSSARAGGDVTIHKGSSFLADVLDGGNAAHLGHKTSASEFIISALSSSSNAEGVTIVCIGSLTNVAAAVTQSPAVAKRIKRIVILGGDLSGGPKGWSHDLNFRVDPAAADLIFNSDIPKTVIPVQLCMQAAFGHKDVSVLENCPGTVVFKHWGTISRWVDSRIKKYAENGFKDYPEYTPGGFFPWDLFAIMYTTDPEMFAEETPYSMHIKEHKEVVAFPESPGSPDQNVVLVRKLRDQRVFLDAITRRLCEVPGVAGE